MKHSGHKKKTKHFSVFFVFLILLSAKTINTNAQICTTTSFATYFGYTWRGQAGCFEKTADTGYLFSVVKNELKNVVTKVDTNTNIIWSKTYDYIGSTYLLNTFQYNNSLLDNDGNYFIDLVGDAVALLDPQGNVITTKLLDGPLPNTMHEILIHSLLVLPDNRKLVFLQDFSSAWEYNYAVVCLSADLSTIVWTKNLKQYQFLAHKMVLLENKLHLLAQTTGPVGTEAIIITLDANTGNQLDQVKFISNEIGGNIWLRNLYRYNNGYILQARTNLQGFGKYCFLRLDNSFNIIRSYYFVNSFDSPNDPNPYDMPLFVEPDGSFYGAKTEPFGHLRFYVSSSDSVIWDRYVGLSGYGSLFGLCKSNDGFVLFCRSEVPDGSTLSSHALSITKSTLNGIFPGCSNYPLGIVQIPLQVVKGTSDVPVIDTTIFTLLNVTPLVEENTFMIDNRCNGVSTCSSVVVQGPTSLCSSSPVSFTALRNQYCFTSIDWEVIGGNSNIIKINDSTVNVNFLQQGNYKVVVKLGTNCFPITDTIEVNVLSVLPPLNIGPPDSALCTNTTIRLDAGSGFASYLWQDGSTNQVFDVATPGLYHVTVRDQCDQVFKDSILITAANTPALDIGIDKSVCFNDTCFINASPGFQTYTWQPINEIHGQGQSIFVIPKNDVRISVIARTTEGCIATDTINVKVFPLPTPNLGQDIKLCEPENKVIEPGEYVSYVWNDNSKDRYLNVKNTGIYWVYVIDRNNCKGSDTIQVVKKYCVQSVYIPNAFTPNNDSKNDLFKATAFGDVLTKFELYVYNKYGQIVFYSTDINKGWDGTFNGKLQPASSYVWRCIYRFDAKFLNNETGSVILVR